MKALVTGSNGFIGSHLVEALVGKGYEVHCLVRKTSNMRWLKDLKIRTHIGDATEKSSLYKAVSGMDYIYHAGGVINGNDWQHFYSVNCTGTKNLAQVCVETNPSIKKFVFISSISAAGPSEKDIAVNEDMQCHPVSDYGKSKLAAELDLKGFMKKMPITIIRPSTILGIREDDFFSILKLVKSRIIPLLGNSDKQTSLCFVQDLVKGIILAGERNEATGKTYFISDGNAYSWSYVIETAMKYLNIKPPYIKVSYPVMYLAGLAAELASKLTGKKAFFSRDRVKEARDVYWLYDISKIKKELGFVPEVVFEQGMKDSIEWYRKRGEL